jgi:hypothetical protein
MSGAKISEGSLSSPPRFCDVRKRFPPPKGHRLPANEFFDGRQEIGAAL